MAAFFKNQIFQLFKGGLNYSNEKLLLKIDGNEKHVGMPKW